MKFSPLQYEVILHPWKSKQDLWHALNKKGIQISKSAKYILDRTIGFARDLVSEDAVVHVVTPSVFELGFNTAYRTEICDQAISHSLRVMRPQVGLEFFLQYIDQLKNDQYFVFGMEPINDDVGQLTILYLRICSNGRVWLESDAGYPGECCGPSYLFVFEK